MDVKKDLGDLGVVILGFSIIALILYLSLIGPDESDGVVNTNEIFGDWTCKFQMKGFRGGTLKAHLDIDDDYQFIMTTIVHKFENGGLSVRIKESGKIEINNIKVYMHVKSASFDEQDLNDPSKETLIKILAPSIDFPRTDDFFINELTKNKFIFYLRKEKPYPRYICTK